MYQSKQFWLDSFWRSFRTFCQTLAGMLVVVQTSNAIPSTTDINIPWQAYLYASAIAGLVSLLQSVDRERAVNSTEPAAAAAAFVTPIACGDKMR